MTMCSVKGCGKPHYGRGWCNAHYTRWRRHGDPLGGGTEHDTSRRCRYHPGRRVKGYGLCGSCYNRFRLQRTELRCANHPDQPEFARGLCNSCYQSQQRIRTKYSLNPQQHQHIMSQPCGICGGTTQVVDHDHSTNEVRGGLCTRCNVNLGVIETWYNQYREQITAWTAK